MKLTHPYRAVIASIVFMVSGVGIVAELTGCGGGGGGGDSNALAPAAPAGNGITISAEPQGQAVLAGQTATFTIAASATSALSYQWQRDGSDIAGATAASYSTPQLTASSSGQQYRVRLTTSAGSIISSTALLQVHTDASVPAPTEHIVNPIATDNGVDASFGNHYAYFNPAIARQNKLFVFFPGTVAQPQDYRLIVKAAANNGFHAIGLAYPNTQVPFDACALAIDPACAGNVREEQLTGTHTTAAITVAPANSIDNRLRKTLHYLAQQFPQENWSMYLDATNSGSAPAIRWNLLRVAGHSQGAGTAAYIGKRFAVDRAILFSGPGEQIAGQVATWVATPGVTDSGYYYGLTHIRDATIGFASMQQNWLALQMGAASNFVDIDANSPPYSGAHMLSTNRNTTGALPFHNMTVADTATPLDAASLPVYRDAWQYLCFQ